MAERVSYLGIGIDADSTDLATDKAIEYLGKEESCVIYGVSGETAVLIQKNEMWKGIVEGADLVLPGDSIIRTGLDEVMGDDKDSFFFAGFLERILDNATENGYEVFVVASDEDTYNKMRDEFQEKRPYLSVSGISLSNLNDDMFGVVNEINSIAPDILILSAGELFQLKLLEGHRDQINAGVIISAGNVINDPGTVTVKSLKQKISMFFHRRRMQ